MPFSDIFTVETVCKEHDCKINKKNISKIFKPDKGFINKSIEKIIFPENSYKICDCIISCNNNNIFIVEILCGILTYSEFKDKMKQIESCCKVVKHKSLEDKITKIILLYKTLDTRNPNIKKSLLNSKICNKSLIALQYSRTEITC